MGFRDGPFGMERPAICASNAVGLAFAPPVECRFEVFSIDLRSARGRLKNDDMALQPF